MKKRVYYLGLMGIILVALGAYIIIAHCLAVIKAQGAPLPDVSDNVWFDPSFVGYIPILFGLLFICLAFYTWRRYVLEIPSKKKLNPGKNAGHKIVSADQRTENQRIFDLHAHLITPGMRR